MRDMMKRPAIAARLAAVAIVAAVVAFPQAASAQHVAVIVNGAPITTYDIEQRIRFTALATHKTPSRQEVIQDLIDEKLKVQIGERYKLEVSDTEVNASFASIGQRMRMTPQQLTAELARNGVDAQTLKSKIRSDIAWQQIVRGKFQSSLQVREKDVFAKLAANPDEKKKDTGYEYTLRPILFIVQAGSSEAAIDGRKREAEALRGRFENCNSGLTFAHALRDVAVRDPIVKSSADLGPELRKILDGIEVGKLTSPEVTPQGVQMFALCARKENKLDAAGTKEVRDQMFAEQFQAKSKRYLEVLRKSAMIEVK
ncbi:MAG TPA: SurA N-terminal domain-containing protein [Xanthobacteraceae bacterium]|nr:SurA N-terminal domain-containing protein [Xanthobacteraceae bacterium]